MMARFGGIGGRPLLALVLLGLVACGGGQATGEDVSAPAEVQGEAHGKVTLVVQLPQDGDVVRHDQPVRFLLGTDCLACTVRGVSNLGGELFALIPSSTGMVDRSVEGLAQGVHRLSLQVLAADGELLLNRDLTVRVNHPPAAPSVSLAPATPVTDDDLLATVGPAADEDGDAVTYSWVWTRDAQPVAEVVGPSLNHSLTARGETWKVTVTPSDPYEEGVPGSAHVVIADSPPALESARVEPAEGGTVASGFECVHQGWEDPDATDPVRPLIQWRVNGVAQGAPAEGLEHLVAGFHKHDQLACRVVPWDGEREGSPVDSDPVEVANALPTLGLVDLTSAVGDVTGTFDCLASGAADADGDQVSLKVRWIVDGQPWPGETSQSLAGSLLVRGQTLECEVSGFDGEDDGPAVRSEAVTVLDAPPTLVSALVTPLEATEATVLTCEGSGVADPDGDQVTLAFAWTVNGQPLEGAGGPTLDGAWFARGDEVRCAAIPVANGLAGAPVEAKLAVVIGNAPPALAGAQVWPPEPREGDQVECQPQGPTDLDGDALTYAVEWRVNGLPPDGWASDTLTGEAFDKGDLLACTLTPHDGLEAGAPVDSAAVAAVNSPPALAQVALVPGEGNVSVSFTCLPSGLTDPDPGDTVVPLYSWYLDDAPMSEAGLPFLTPALASAGQVLRCSVVPFDGTDPGAPRGSNAVTLANEPPVLAGAHLEPEVVGDKTSPRCVPDGFLDPEGAVPAYLFAWYVNGALLEGAATDTLAADLSGIGDTLFCRVVPFDGVNQGAAVDSAIATVIDECAFAEICDSIDNDCDGLTDEGLCDDGNPCTDDACVPGGGCVAPPNLAACDDGSACTRLDQCQGGECLGSDPVECPAGDDCHAVGACEAASGLCPVTVRTGQACDDADPATSNTTCDPDGACTCKPDCTGRVCGDDGCGGACGSCAPTTCEDLFHHTGRTCQQGLCVYAAAEDCDDGNPCTDDACDAAQGCSNADDDSNPCADALACSLTACRAGACVVTGASAGCLIDGECVSEGGLLAPTGDGSCRACLHASAWDAWTVRVAGGACDDGDPASVDDACTAGGACVGCVPQCAGRDCGPDGCGRTCGDCEDHDPCSQESCSVSQTCDYVWTVCQAADCQVSSTCDGHGGCTVVNSAGGVTCASDGNPCTDDVCAVRIDGFVKTPAQPFEDATLGGTPVPITGDEACSEALPIGFAFNYFGTAYTQFWVNTNGLLLFLGPTTAYMNWAAPSTNFPNGWVAAYWDDLSVPPTGGVYYKLVGNAPDRRLVVEWSHVRRNLYPTDDLTFEVILFEVDGRVALRYGAMLGAQGESATAAVESADGLAGATFSNGFAELKTNLSLLTTASPAGVCDHWQRPAGSPCDDGDPCTDGDACDASGVCVGVKSCPP
jgi:hypothetical protein